MYPLIWWRNKAVIITRDELQKAFIDLLRYYEQTEENRNTKAVKQALQEILTKEI